MKRSFLVGLLVLYSLTLAAFGFATSQAQTIQDFLRSLEVGKAVSYRNLTIIPLLGRARGLLSLTTLDNALRNQELIVSEIGQGQVNNLSVENLSKIPVFIMAGEILSGAKQNRVTQEDVIIPGHSGRIDVGAFCVEHGRWSYNTPNQNFKSENFVSNPSVRAAAQSSKSQSEVWGKVSEVTGRLGVSGGSGALDEAYRAPEVRGNVDDYVRHFVDMPQNVEAMQGAVVVIGSRVLAADCFGNHQLAARLWEKLIRSYALEALQDGTDGGGWTNSELARAFLNRAMAANYTQIDSPGVGYVMDISSANLTGSAMVYSRQAVHVALFPHASAMIPMRPEESEPAIQRTYPR